MNKPMIIALGAIALIVGASDAMAQRFGGGYRGGGYRPSSPSRPVYTRPNPPSTTAKPTTAPRSSNPSAPFRARSQFAYGGRQYTPVSNGNVNFLFWYLILSNGERQRQSIDCRDPKTGEERRACDRAF